MSNEEAIKQLKKLQSFHNGSYAPAIDKAIEALKEERPQGEWIEKQETPASVSYYCSNCKMSDLPVLPYCPWCGAKMKGGVE